MFGEGSCSSGGLTTPRKRGEENRGKGGKSREVLDPNSRQNSHRRASSYSSRRPFDSVRVGIYLLGLGALVFSLAFASYYLDYLNVYQAVGFQVVLTGGTRYNLSYAVFTEMAIFSILIVVSVFFFRFNKYLGVFCFAAGSFMIYMLIQELLNPAIGWAYWR
jgi:hypothetical protein